jgi:hypothetical protein
LFMQQTCTVLSTLFSRGLVLLLLVVLPVLGWGQTTIFNVAGGGALPTNWVGVNNVTTNAIDRTTYYLVDAGNPSDLLITDSYNLASYSTATFTVSVATFGSGANNPAKIEISYDGGGNYTQSAVTATPTSTTYNTSTSIALTGVLTSQVKIRISNNAATGQGVRLQNIKLVANTSTPTPTIAPSPAARSGFTYVAGNGPSASQSFNLGGTNLTAGAVVNIAAPTDYEISLTAGSGYGSTLSLPNTAGGSLNTTIYARLIAGLPAATYNESVSITGGGTSGTTTVAVNGSVTPAPVLSATPTSLTGFTTSQGAPSTAQTYLLSGTNLSSSVTVTAPAGYEVAQGTPTVPGTYAATQTVTQTNATAGRTIYVRLTAAATAGTYGTPGTPVNVTNAATNAATLNVPVDGTVTAPAPVIAVTGTLTAFNTLAGSPSTAQSYTLTGSYLTADVTVTPPAGYEVSQTSATAGFAGDATPITVAQTSGSVSATIYVRLTGTTAGTFVGSVANTSPGAATQNVAVTGTVVGEPATTPAPTVVAGTTTATSVPLTLTAGAGTNLLVVVRPDATAATAPTDGTTYTANTTYGSGTALGAGFVVFAAANATSVTVAGLTPSTSYVADVYSYNVGTVAGFENYQPAGGTSAVFTTPAPPVAPVGDLLLEEYFDYPAATVLASSTTVPDALTGWTAYSGNNTNNIPTAASNQLQAQYPQGAALSASPAATSSQASLRTNGQDIYKPFALPAGAATIYISAVVNVTAAQAAGDYFLNLYDTGSGGGVLRSRVFARSTTGGINFGVSVGGASNVAVYSPTLYALNTPYLLVAKYETNGTALITNDDVISLYVIGNSATPTSEPATPTATSGPEALAAANTGLNAIALRQGSASGAQAAPTVLVDGLRVASGWGAAVGRPVYTATAATIAPGNYYDVTVNNADVLTLNGAVKVEGSLNLTSGKVATSDANLLTLYATATTTGGSATSFVNGPLARVTTGPAITVFPVGKGTAYRPLTLNAAAQTGTTTYTGEVQNSSARTTGVDAPLTRVSNIRYATLTPDVQPTAFSGTLTMAFDVDDYVTDPQDNTLVMAKRNGSANWVSIGRTSATGSAASGNVAGDLTSGVFTSFSDFALASTAAAVDNTLGSNPLPVELTAFSAQRQADKTVLVKWSTASEKNSARFEVQRSLDGREYKLVSTVAAQGTSTQATAYVTFDKTPPAGRLYYRLRQVDLDGSSAYSPVVMVTSSGETTKVELYPNPAHSRISFIAEAATPYRVLNQLGQAVLRGTTEAGTASIGIEALPTGLYLLELQTAAGRTVQKFEKQ